MSKFKLAAKFIFIILIITALSVWAVILLIKHKAKPTIESFISKSIGANMRFGSVKFDPEKYKVFFTDLEILSDKGPVKTHIFAGSCAFILDKESLLRDKKALIKNFDADKCVLTLERIGKEFFQKADAGGYFGGIPSACAVEIPASGFYHFVSNVESISIRNSSMIFIDNYLRAKPFKIGLNDFNFSYVSKLKEDKYFGGIPVECAVSFRIHDEAGGLRGEVDLAGKISVFIDRFDSSVNINTKNVDLTCIREYIASYTPFSVNAGLFSSNTTVQIERKIVRSMTTIYFHRLGFYIRPGMENAQFLQTTANKLANYLRTGNQDIMIDVIVEGPIDRPQIGLGPNTKWAVERLMTDETNRVIQQMMPAN